MHNTRGTSRPGVTVVEVAVTAPLALLLIIGLMVGGLGVFRYQQVAFLAREGAAYAALHGPYYAKRTGKPMVTADDVREQVIVPMARGLNPKDLDCAVMIDLDANVALVTVQYAWRPEGFLKARRLSSTAVMPIEQ